MPPPATPSDRRAILYARVSSQEQADVGYSLESQADGMRAYAARAGLEIVAERVVAESAKSAGRAAFGEMLAALQRKDGPRHLLIEKIDRVTRNLRDFVALDDLRLAGLTVHAVKPGRVYGPRSPSADLLEWEFQAMIARHHVRNLSEETRKGMRAKRESGGWCHVAPIGLVNAERNGRRSLVHDPDRAPKVRLLFEAIAHDGLTLGRASGYAQEIGLVSRAGRPLALSTLQRLLRHPLLAGLTVREDGELRPADVKPVVEPLIWWAVQDALDGRRRGRGNTGPVHAHAFAGLLRCDCGHALTGEVQRGRHGRGCYTYYRCAARPCTSRSRPIREADAVEAVADALDAVTLSLPDRAVVRAEIVAAVRVESASARARLDSLAREDGAARRRLAVLYEDRLDERIDASTYDAQAARVRRRLAEIAAQREQLGAADDGVTEEALALLDALATAGDLVRRASRESLRRSLHSLLDGPATVARGSISVRLHPLIAALASEPHATGDGSTACVATAGLIPAWLPRSSDLRTLREALAGLAA